MEAVFFTQAIGRTTAYTMSFMYEAKLPFIVGGQRIKELNQLKAQDAVAVKFDWNRPTWDAPFNHEFPDGKRITSMYLVTPDMPRATQVMLDYIDYTFKEKGVKRFVIVTGTHAKAGEGHIGKLWQRFIDLGAEYAILRATWMMESFCEGLHLKEMKKGRFYSCSGQAKVPLVSAFDVAAVAYHALLNVKSFDCDYRILGPEHYTYDQVAERITSLLGKKIIHQKLSEGQKTELMLRQALDWEQAKFLTFVDVEASKGAEEGSNDVIEKITGRPPKTFEEFLEAHKPIWVEAFKPQQ